MGSRVNARLESLFLAFENYCVKANTDRPVLYGSCSSGTGNITLMPVFVGILYRKETSNDSIVARHAHVLRSHAEVYSLCA